MTGSVESRAEPVSLVDVGLMGRGWNSAWFLLTAGNLFWAGNIIVGRLVVDKMPAVSLSFWRWTGAFLLAFWFAWPHLRKDWPLLLEHWKIVLVLSATGIALFNTLAYIGLAGTSAVNVLLLQSIVPLIVTIWSFVFFRERPSARLVAAIMISLAGVMFVASRGSMSALLTFSFHPSDCWVFASVVIYGIYVALLRLRPDVHPLSFMQAAMGLGIILLAPFQISQIILGSGMITDWKCAAGLFYMAVFPSFVSYYFFNRAASLIGGARAGHSIHLVPVFGAVMAVVFLGERLHLYHATGAALIAAGLGLAHFNRDQPRSSGITQSGGSPRTTRWQLSNALRKRVY